MADLAPLVCPEITHRPGSRGQLGFVVYTLCQTPCYKQLIFRCRCSHLCVSLQYTVTLCQTIFGLLLLLCLHGLSRPGQDKRLETVDDTGSYLVLSAGAEVGLRKADLATAAGVHLSPLPVPGPVSRHPIPQEPVPVVLSRGSPVVISVSVSADIILRLSECETQEQNEQRGLEKRF